MKKIISLVLCAILAFALIGCVDTAKQDAILKYINEDLASLTELETLFYDSYSSVSGDNYTDDETMYEELSNNTVIYARQLSDAATNLSSGIKDSDLLAVHKLYMEASTNNLNAITMIMAALENQDYEQVSAANELLGKANTLLIDFSDQLNTLAEANDITIE